MITCGRICPAGSWDITRAVDTVVLDFDGRHRRRVALSGESGLAFLLDLPRATTMRDGDGLVLSDGAIVCVKAAPERLIEIMASDIPSLVRIAWHLGNRHLPTQLLGDRLHIREDHVIRDMVEGLGGSTRQVVAPFDPEGGAFVHGGNSGHRRHGHGAEHDHPHRHD